jgi:2-iminobutanoate/2-iminopropanoate deaminase
MTREAVRTDRVPAPGSYSQGLRSGGFLFTQGVNGYSPETGAVVGTTIEEQTAQAMENIKDILAAAGLEMSDIVKTTVHLSHMRRDFLGFEQEYRKWFDEPYPARTTVNSGLWKENYLVEIDAVAYAGG